MPFFDCSLKYLCYFGGPALADFLIHGALAGGPPAKLEDIGPWLDQFWSLTTKRRSVQTVLECEINKYNYRFVLDAHTRIVELAQRAKAPEAQHSSFARQINAFLQDLPYTIGGAGPAVPGELRDDELLTGAAVPREELAQQLPPGRAGRQGPTTWSGLPTPGTGP